MYNITGYNQRWNDYEKTKANMWFLLWFIFIGIGSALSAVSKYHSIPIRDTLLEVPPFTDFQLLLLLLFTPLVLLPLLCISYYYAKKENNKKIKIASLCLIIHHIICVIAVLFQVL